MIGLHTSNPQVARSNRAGGAWPATAVQRELDGSAGRLRSFPPSRLVLSSQAGFAGLKIARSIPPLTHPSACRIM